MEQQGRELLHSMRAADAFQKSHRSGDGGALQPHPAGPPPPPEFGGFPRPESTCGSASICPKRLSALRYPTACDMMHQKSLLLVPPPAVVTHSLLCPGLQVAPRGQDQRRHLARAGHGSGWSRRLAWIRTTRSRHAAAWQCEMLRMCDSLVPSGRVTYLRQSSEPDSVHLRSGDHLPSKFEELLQSEHFVTLQGSAQQPGDAPNPSMPPALGGYLSSGNSLRSLSAGAGGGAAGTMLPPQHQQHHNHQQQHPAGRDPRDPLGTGTPSLASSISGVSSTGLTQGVGGLGVFSSGSTEVASHLMSAGGSAW